MMTVERCKKLISPEKQPDKQFFLDLCDEEKALEYENERVAAVLALLKALYIAGIRKKIKEAEERREYLMASDDSDPAKYSEISSLSARVSALGKKLEGYKPFFAEPYFARMDAEDDKEGYNSYYIGKKGDEGLEIVDWRAPIARRYYQKSRFSFTINDYDYKVVLRRALRTRNGKVLSVKNEYLSLKGYVPEEELPPRGEEVVFDPFLKEILRERKEKDEITDIIQTIQEKQYAIITLPEEREFTVQGVAGSGKTMIMLHRLSYITYNNDAIKPSDVLVLTPSDSFNAFIDELSGILEVERVRTSTLENYFLTLLKSVGIDAAARTDYSFVPPENYLSFIYSDAFGESVRRKFAKIYDAVYGMFASDECAEFCRRVGESCRRAEEEYDFIKNRSLRVRRLVLGEIKEKPDGGLRYTKLFRTLFNCVYEVEDFVNLALGDVRMKEYGYFYRRLTAFYKAMRFIRKNHAAVCRGASADLYNLSRTVEKEIADLKRYKTTVGGVEVLTYADRVEKRGAMLAEIEKTREKVRDISSVLSLISEFGQVLKGERYLSAIGRCESVAEIASFFYRETVKKYKAEYGVPGEKLCRSDAYAISFILTELGFGLSPKFAFLFVDEAQDVSAGEYAVLRKVNPRAAFNVFGDLKQNVTPFRGVSGWEALGLETYELDLNYRNTNEIVSFVAGTLGIAMRSIGLDGGAVEFIGERGLNAFFAGKKGLCAVITSEKNLGRFCKRGFVKLRDKGCVSKTAVNVMTVYESKGLEFSSVAVADGDMSDNEKYIAYTRALKNLAIVR